MNLSKNIFRDKFFLLHGVIVFQAILKYIYIPNILRDLCKMSMILMQYMLPRTMPIV